MQPVKTPVPNMAERRKRPTLQDIADSLEVSKRTVTQVLSRQPGARISDAMRKRVRTKARAMGHRPNRIASSLRTGVTNRIGLVTGNVRVLTNPGTFRTGTSSTATGWRRLCSLCWRNADGRLTSGRVRSS